MELAVGMGVPWGFGLGGTWFVGAHRLNGRSPRCGDERVGARCVHQQLDWGYPNMLRTILQGASGFWTSRISGIGWAWLLQGLTYFHADGVGDLLAHAQLFDDCLAQRPVMFPG